MAGKTLAALVVSMALCALPGATVRAASPSFDCGKAGNWAEKTICQNDELAALDAWFSPLYGQVVGRLPAADADSLRAQRKAWLKSRNDCKADTNGAACLTTRYREFISDLEGRLAGLVSGGASSMTPATKAPLAECSIGADPSTCLEQLIEAEESNLATAESTAEEAALNRDQATQATHMADRLAEANVAWRGYRNAECKRRQEGAASEAEGPAVYSACLVELTRKRIAELTM
jgi:uncharacterized protein